MGLYGPKRRFHHIAMSINGEIVRGAYEVAQKALGEFFIAPAKSPSQTRPRSSE